jgi:Fic family protein
VSGLYEDRTWEHDPALYAPARYRKACRYRVFIPDALEERPVNLPGSVAGVVSDAEDAIRRMNAQAHPALQPLARLLLRTESIASSKVEGMQVDVRDLARAEARAETSRKVASTALEVLANIDAMQFAIDGAAATASLTPAQVHAIHHRLMIFSPRPAIAGKVRAGQNWIGGNDYNPCGADFVPPPPEHVASLVEDMCAAVNDETLPPLVQSALIHAQFETIHPYDDGNGRTGRALVQVVLRRRGLAPSYVPPISVVLATDRERYIEGLTWYRHNRVADWIELFAGAAARAATLASSYLEAVAALQDRWRQALSKAGNPRADAAAWAVIDVLPAYPAITSPVAAASTGRAKASVHQAIGQLVDAEILIPLSESKRNQAWEAAGLLDLLVSLEAGKALAPTRGAVSS